MPDVRELRDSIDLLVSAIIVAGLHGTGPNIDQSGRTVVSHADDIGRLLQRALARVTSPDEHASIPYEWRPVLEFMGHQLQRIHLLQIECTRRYVEALTAPVGGELGRQVDRLLTPLQSAVEHGLRGAPRSGSGDYAGISSLPQLWSRRFVDIAVIPPK